MVAEYFTALLRKEINLVADEYSIFTKFASILH